MWLRGKNGIVVTFTSSVGTMPCVQIKCTTVEPLLFIANWEYINHFIELAYTAFFCFPYYYIQLWVAQNLPSFLLLWLYLTLLPYTRRKPNPTPKLLTIVSNLHPQKAQNMHKPRKIKIIWKTCHWWRAKSIIQTPLNRWRSKGMREE